MSATEERVERRALFYCSRCDHPFFLKERQARSLAEGERSQLCKECRRGKDYAEVIVTPRLRRFWSSQFTYDEIVEMAEGMWGPRSRWPQSARPVFLIPYSIPVEREVRVMARIALRVWRKPPQAEYTSTSTNTEGMSHAVRAA